MAGIRCGGSQTRAIDGEDFVFPIQVSVDLYCYAGNAIVFMLAVRPEIEGEELFPIQVHSISVIFIAALTLFLLLLPPGKLQGLCQKSNNL